MAIFKYKKPNSSGGYSIKEMPVISNIYTEYVVQDATDGTRTITLTPLHTSESTGAGAFENVIASVKLLSSNPTYAPTTSSQTITYGASGFPKGITISAIPTTTETYTSSGSKQEYNFTTSTGFPTKVTINAMPASTPPSDLSITTPSETITISAGYYSSDVVINSNITNRGNIKDQTQIKPSNYSSTYYNTGYYTGGSTNGKINIATKAITLTTNNKTYTYSDSEWGNSFPTSITVQVPSDLPDPSTPPSDLVINTQGGTKTISAGYYTSDITISASLPTSTVPSDTTISSPSDTVTIPAGYLSNAVTINSNITNRGAPENQSLKPQTKTSYTVSSGYYSTGFTVSPSTQTLTSTNPSLTQNSSTGYYEKTYTSSTSTASSTVWGDNYLTSLTVRFTNKSPSSNQMLFPGNSSYTIPTGYHATSSRTVSVSNGSKSITSNGTYYASTDGYYYSSVTVDVPTNTMSDYGSLNIGSNGTFSTSGSGYYYSSVNVDVSYAMASGTVGTNNSISWRVYYDGTLVIDGSGAIPSYSFGGSPWYEYSSVITSVLIGDGIYEIGKWGVAGLYNVTQISISNSVHKLNQCAFWRTGENYNYLNIYLPASIYSLGSGAFGWGSNSSNSIMEVRFTGNVPTGTVSSDAFSSPIRLFEVTWDSSIKTTTSMCSNTVSSSSYNYNAQTDDGYFK